MSQIENPGRRRFVKQAALSGVGFTLGFQLLSCSDSQSVHTFSPNAWLSILEDGQIIIKISKMEMGQDISTTIATILCEELDAEWQNITTEFATAQFSAHSLYTAGSNSTRSLWLPLRQAGATARQLLVNAAANQWQLPNSECYTKNGRIYNKANNQSLAYSELTQHASHLDLPDNVALKEPKNFSLIGSEKKQLDLKSKVTGRVTYGMDFELDNLHYAAIVHAPVIGAKLVSVGNDGVLSKPGVSGLVKLENAVAVVANSFWLAQKCLEQLEIKWSESALGTLSSRQIFSELTDKMVNAKQLIEQAGAPSEQVAAFELEREFKFGYLPHLPMETMNCTVHIHDNGCDVWVPTQDPKGVLRVVRESLHSKVGLIANKVFRKIGISDDVRIIPMQMGGSFGRRLHHDFVQQAVQIASNFEFPVKLIWTREEDIRRDYFRPASVHKLSIKVARDGRILQWKHDCAGASQGYIAEGALKIPYQFNYGELQFAHQNHGVSIGSWRSVSFAHHIFILECLIDEIAEKLQQDPIAYRLSLLDDERAVEVLKSVARLSNWHTNAEKKLGVALFKGFESYIALVAEVSLKENQQCVDKLYCVADIGTIVHPDAARAQIEGGLLFGLNAVLNPGASFDGGQISQSNFHDAQSLRIAQLPDIELELINNNHSPGGVGEIAVPPVGPAVANAYANLTGTRFNSIPKALEA
ncbi:MAG: molybdopterin-dependent oxidoreductase [Kangiellaceae bacterium]|nr:molybdopterin-dependent oxidoreductase [Kangiellaceae bacterium]